MFLCLYRPNWYPFPKITNFQILYSILIILIVKVLGFIKQFVKSVHSFHWTLMLLLTLVATKRSHILKQPAAERLAFSCRLFKYV